MRRPRREFSRSSCAVVPLRRPLSRALGTPVALGASTLAVLTALGVLGACGTRSGLGVLDEPPPGDTQTDGGLVALPPVPPRDTFDARAPDLDALPPIDARPPSHDAAVRNDCPDAGATLVYVVTAQSELFSFYPPDRAFRKVGNLACPASGGATPFSMTVDRKGVAYVVFTDGELFRVSTSTAACATTRFVIGQMGFTTFGMGYVANPEDGSETLFIAQDDLVDNAAQPSSKGLGIIDTTAFKVRLVAPFDPPMPPAELTGTGDGRLFAWAPDRPPATSGSHLYQIDKSTGRVLGRNALRAGEPRDAFAFAFWGGDFYIFTSPQGPSTVTKVSLGGVGGGGSESTIATLPSTIVGAGVSTCAPQ